MIKSQYKYSDLTGKIIGCAMEVDKELGNGFQEVLYQRALAHEFEMQQIGFAREFEMQVHYKQKHIGTRRVDFLVENIISPELKAVTNLEPIHLNQALNYLEVGLLINFGKPSLEFHRLHNKKFTPSVKSE